MSREIDFDNVQEDDLEYIAQRPWIAEEMVRQGYDDPLEGFEMTPPGSEEDSSEEETSEEEEEGAEDEADTGDDDYDEWSYEELRAESKSRGLGGGGSGEEIKARLREDDAS